jgi:N-acetylmuramoyl-L-alanine amidase
MSNEIPINMDKVIHTIALDDGHGMETAGKRTPMLPDGIKGETGFLYMHENEFNRAVVEKADLNLRRCGFDVVLTAPGDTDVSLYQRVQNAERSGAELFISVHANALTGRWGDQQGVSVHYYPGSMISKAYAKIFLDYLILGTLQKNRGVIYSDFYVLRENMIPAVLIEAAFMDNLKEAKMLLSDTFRQEVADEITKAACSIFNVGYVSPEYDLTYDQAIELIAKYTETDPGYWSNRPFIDKWFTSYVIKIAKSIQNKII